MDINETITEMLTTRDEPRRPYLRKKFYARKHPVWGGAVCWYVWSPVYGWQVRWGISCESLREAKIIRRFLNQRVNPFRPVQMPFHKVAEFATSGNVSNHVPKEFY